MSKKIKGKRQNGETYDYYDPDAPKSAALTQDAMLEFRNGIGELVFSVDVSDLSSGGIHFSDTVVSTNHILIEEESSTSFTVALTEAPGQNQPVYIAVSDDSKVSVAPSVLTFTPQNWNVPQTVTVTALPDIDSTDESEIITITSRKATTKQILVSVTDITEPPVDLIENGLDLYFNLRSGESGLTDSVNGVVATNDGGTFTNVGLELTGNNQLVWRYPFDANIPDGFTIEMVSTRTTQSNFRSSYIGMSAAGSGYADGYAYKGSPYDNGSIWPGFAFIKDNETIGNAVVPVSGSVLSADYTTEHTFGFVFNPDGSAYLSFDGIKQGGRSAVSGFQSYKVSGTATFKIPYNKGISSVFQIAGIRFYNRALSEAELLNNHKYDVQQQVAANFT